MGMAAVIYKKGAPDNFVWEEIKVGSPGRGQVRLRSTAVGVNFADTYHRAGIPHPMIVGDPPIVVGFEGVGEVEELGPGITGFSIGERVCTCLPPLGAYSQERLYPADKSKPIRFGRRQPRTNSSADARQRARSSCFHSSKRPQKGRQNNFGRFGG